MGKRGPKPKNVIDTTWRPELAYVVGLIVSDGSLSKDRIHIDFSSKDIDILETYKNCLSIQNIKIGIKYRASDHAKKYYRVQFGNVIFYQWLESIGLTQNKSLSISSIAVPDKYFFDFLRGEWDGDGTIYSSKDKRYKNSLIVSLGFASGSLNFLEWLQKEINDRLNTTGHIHKGKGVFQLRYAQKDTKTIFLAMFYRSGLPHLARKFAKAKKILKMDGLHSL